MSALFVAQGAPDLALTQAAVETVSTVLFVLVLRKLPDRFERRSTPATRRSGWRCRSLVATVFVFVLRDRRSRVADRDPGLGRDDRAGTPRRARSQCRQRDPRRLPWVGHDGRAHRARGGRDRRRRARQGRAPAGVRRPPRRIGARREPDPPGDRRPRDRPHRAVGGRHLLRRHARVGVPAVRRPQPSRVAASSADSSPAAGSPSATSSAGSTTSGIWLASGRGRSSAAGVLTATPPPQPSRSCSAEPPSSRAKHELDLPVFGHVGGVVGDGVRPRRVRRRHRSRADGVRGVRRRVHARSAGRRTGAAREGRDMSVVLAACGRGPVRDRHVPRAPAQAEPHHHRARPAQPWRQRAVADVGSRRSGADHRRLGRRRRWPIRCLMPWR